MNRADRLKQEGDNKRSFTVGFALTVLQRRLASSPEAILKSLERRSKRLEKRRHEMRYGESATQDSDLARRLSEMLGRDLADEDEIDDVPSGEAEEIESEVADAATAARTIAELDKELAILADLVEVARRVRHSGIDKKWTELRDLLTDNTMVTGEKIIIFTEHRDTLEYLAERIRGLIGRPDAVVTIHGGVSREERRKITELFTQDIDTRILVATDAAGEGLEGNPLRDLLVKAIRYGNQPEVRARLHEIIDKTVGEGLDKLIAERAAHADIFATADLEKWRARMDEARARRLQPHYIRAFFMAAFTLLGGRLSERESGRYEIRHVNADIRDRDRQTGLGAPVLTKYERVPFDKELTRPVGKPGADLLAPGHPLLDAVTDLIIERYGTLLKQGTMFADRHESGEEPRLLVAVTHEITDGHDPARTVTKKFGFAEV